MAVARYLRDVDCRSQAVVIVFFDEEEQGELGSNAFAQLLVGDGRPVTAAYTADQLGWDQDGDRAIEIERPDGDLLQQLQASDDAGGFGLPLLQTNTGGTDHVAFRAHGIDAAGFSEEYVNGDTTPYYHQPTDTVDTVDFDYLAAATSLVAYHFARITTAP